MGLSPFKTRYQLLCEKAGLWTDDFAGNVYTEYGNILEPKIRDHINSQMPLDCQFEPSRITNGDIRCHTDGFNGHCVLEIKTASRVYETAEEHKRYLVQLLLYMQENHVEYGLLAVYQRDNTFDTDFDPATATYFIDDMHRRRAEIRFSKRGNDVRLLIPAVIIFVALAVTLPIYMPYFVELLNAAIGKMLGG
jgi:hypothetical protein